MSEATLKRLSQLEQPTVAHRGGLLIVPRILDLDTWEIQARAYYARWQEADALDRAASDVSNARNRRHNPSLTR